MASESVKKMKVKEMIPYKKSTELQMLGWFIMVVPDLVQDLWLSWMCWGSCACEHACTVLGTVWTKGISLPKNGLALLPGF